MKIVATRCLKASVKIENKQISEIENGLLLLVGFKKGDNSDTIDYMVNKVLSLRIFNDDKNIMNKSVIDIGGSILSVSQFTLYASTNKGNRPSYIEALESRKAKLLYDEFNEKLKKHINLKTGIFGSNMQVSSINDGPVTIILER